MRLLVLSLLMSSAVVDAAQCERLDRRFGDDRERGYRAEREFEGRETGFRNKDRANFLGAKPDTAAVPAFPKTDLQAPAKIGLQR